MDRYIMPEFKDRIKGILNQEESDVVTTQWNTILRDIMFSAVNEDYYYAREQGISMKDAGFLNAQLRVLAAGLCKLTEQEADSMISSLPATTQELLRKEFLSHPEVKIICNSRKKEINHF